MFEYRIANDLDLEKIWNKDISRNPDKECWIKWKKQYLKLIQLMV